MRSLDRILLDRGALDEPRRALLEALAAEHLRRHGGDTEASLAAVGALGPLRAELEGLGDADLQASLAATTSRADRSGGADATADLTPAPRRAGARFRLLRFHREGGLGRVYLARDEELGREVALKEIRPDKAAAADLRGRFVLEAEITGGLEHPGIVPVYSLGSYDDGRPFYAMRFVEGDSLKEAIEAYHKEHPRPDPNAVAFRRLLGRFVDVCEAIAFAHSKGVLHRDIKPGNVIVGRHGETLVVDWGLAKATGRAEPGSGERTLRPGSSSGSAETLPGSTLGTPAYMSPEQAEGDLEALGPRSDVYSLGATLYCLLTGRAPFEGEPNEVLGAVRRGEFRPPRSIDPALEAICLKAMALRPEGRYGSCRALAEDLERWLADEPVSAWREPLSRRAGRWARRHRPAVTGAVAAALAGLVGLAAVAAVQTWSNRKLKEESRKTSLALQAETEARNAATKARNVATEALAQSEEARRRAEAVLGFLKDDVLAAARPKGQEGGLGVAVTVRQAVDAAEPKIAGAFRDQPIVEADVRDTLGETYVYLGEVQLAIRQFERVLELRRARLGPDHLDTLKGRNSLAAAYWLAGRVKDAIEHHEANLPLIESKLGLDHPDTLNSRHNLASDYKAAGRPEDAIRLLEPTLKLMESKLGPDHPDTLNGRNSLAEAYLAAGRTEDAIKLHEANLKLYESKLPPDHPDTLIVCDNIACAYLVAGRTADAIRLHESTLKRFESELGPDHPDSLICQANLAQAYQADGQLERAIPLLEQALQGLRAKVGVDHLYTLKAAQQLADAYTAAGQHAKAEPFLRIGLDRARQQFGPAHPRTAAAMAALGSNLIRRSRWAEAEAILREGLAIRQEAQADDWNTFDTRSLLGESLLGQKKLAEAEPLLLAGYEGLKAREARIPPAGRPRLAEAAERLIRLYEAWGKQDQAAAWKRKLGLADLPADVFARP
jgi:tetratricopeptide (TPR) repeat protein